MAHKMLGVLIANGCKRAMVIHGSDGLDELSTTGPSKVHELLSDGSVVNVTIDAEELGLPPARLEDIRGGDAARNAEAVRHVLAGARGAHRDISVLNSAAGLVVAGLVPDMRSGIDLACTVIDEGRATNVLEALVRVSRRCRAFPRRSIGSERQQVAKPHYPETGRPFDESMEKVSRRQHVLERPVRWQVVQSQPAGERGEFAVDHIVADQTSGEVQGIDGGVAYPFEEVLVQCGVDERRDRIRRCAPLTRRHRSSPPAQEGRPRCGVPREPDRRRFR